MTRSRTSTVTLWRSTAASSGTWWVYTPRMRAGETVSRRATTVPGTHCPKRSSQLVLARVGDRSGDTAAVHRRAEQHCGRVRRGGIVDQCLTGPAGDCRSHDEVVTADTDDKDASTGIGAGHRDR